ncbi:homing endonuclease [Klebsiella phage KP185]|nr:homing endonuclease [Klebsiella phage KP185]
MFVTYLTIYEGDKLPQFYIGSTSKKKFLNGYHGTVVSKKYKEIYNKELKDNPHLFDTCIIEEFPTRKEATACELRYQKLHDVVKSENFFNMAFAAPNGSHGRDTSGENHPLHGSHNGKGNIHSHNPLTGESAFLPYIPPGYVKGRKFKASGHNKGKRWYNNGIDYMMCHPDNVPPGWVLGKLKGAASKAATKMWKRIHENNS